ncbi:MAG: Ger(x)C family spore germination protein [Bacillota bacterium]
MTGIKMLVKMGLLSLLLLGIVITQPACWDRREVEELGIVLATAVEPAPGGRVRVIVQNINPAALGKGMAGGGGGAGVTVTGSKPYRNRSIEGDTVFEALRELSRQTPRQLFFAHNQVILVSEKLARERGVKEVMDFFERNPQIRRTTWLLVGRGDLKALLDEPGRLEDTPAQRIFGIINERRLNSRYAVQMLGDFLEMMESGITQPYTAVIERIYNQAAPEEHKNRLAEGHIAEPHQIIRINGTAVFRRDKLAGWLNSKESRGLLWVRGKVTGGVIDIPDPDRAGRRISLEILHSKAKLQPVVSDGRIYMTVDVSAESNLGETTGPLDLTRPEKIKKLEALQAAAIRDEIESALTKAQQEYGVDVFGFGEAVHRRYPRQWKEIKEDWPELFPGVPVNIHVETKIRRTGMITNPAEPKQQ